MKVIVAGDFCDSARVSGIIERNQYETLFASVRDIMKSVDFSFVNFEFPVVAKEGKPIPKCGPNLKGQPKAVDAIKHAGFNCCTLANNHILDQGEVCLRDTKSRIEAAGIKTVGAGSNLAEASEILYLHKDGQKLAVINCCEHEFTIATDTTAGANPLNPIQQYYKIQEARQNADYVLVIVHGGHEHYQLPSPRMKETYRFFVDAGADAVVNHHQHCYSGYEVYKEKPIFYGIGNFLFDWENERDSMWNEGYMVELTFEKNRIEYELIPYSQGNEDVVVKVMTDITNFNATINKLNRIIADDVQLSITWSDFTAKNRSSYNPAMVPYRSRIFSKLYRMNLLPSFVSKAQLQFIYAVVNCESHRDCFLDFLNNKIDN